MSDPKGRGATWTEGYTREPKGKGDGEVGGATEASGITEPRTDEGAAGLAAIVRDPGRALIALDFDGTLAPIVTDPGAARPHPAVLPALGRLAPSVGTLAIITGRPAAKAVELGGFESIPGLIVIGHHGWERWQAGELSSPPPPPGVTLARDRLPGVLASAGAPDGTWVEDKNHALVVHTRRTADPTGAQQLLAAPLAALAETAGLDCKPGRLVIELRARGTDKGTALNALVAERYPGAVLFAGDDLGDLPAFAAVRAMRTTGRYGVTVYSASGEVTELSAEADLVADGPEGVAALLAWLADALPVPPSRAR